MRKAARQLPIVAIFRIRRVEIGRVIKSEPGTPGVAPAVTNGESMMLVL